MAIVQPDRLAALQGHGLACIVEITLDRQGAEQLDAFEALAVQEPLCAAVLACLARARLCAGAAHARHAGYLALSQRLFTGTANVRNVRAFFA